MAGKNSGRQRKAVDYSEKNQASASGGPAWLLAQQQGHEDEASGRQKENSQPAAGKQASGKQQRKSAPAAVAARGRDAGVTRLPIEEAKAPARAKSTGSGKALAAPAGGQPKQVPGLPGVVVKAAAISGAAATSRPAGAAVPAAKSRGNSKSAVQAADGGKAASTAAAAAVQEKPAAAKLAGGAGRGSQSVSQTQAGDAAAKPGSGSGKRKAAAPPDNEPSRPAAKPAARSAPAATAATKAAAPDAGNKKQKAAPQAPAAVAAPTRPEQERRDQPAPAVDASAAGGQAVLPGSGADALVEQYSANFRVLQAEYSRLQQLYEDLKAAKIDEEVQQLLEQQNKYVTEHGQKAAQLVEQYKLEAQQQAAMAAELGGDALVEQCNKLQADLMNCQQALLDQEAASVDKDKQIAVMQARLGFLERYARQYELRDKCIQTDAPSQACASAQFPSIQSSGVEMLEAHALVPEGAGGGSIYKRPKAASQPVPDPSFTMPAYSPLPAGAIAAVAAAATARSPLAVLAGGVPVSGSDMQLTGDDVQQQQLLLLTQPAEDAPQPPVQQQQRQQPAVQRRQSLQPVAGRMAHAAAAAAAVAPAPRPASAQSQVQEAPAAAAAAVLGFQQPPQQKPQSRPAAAGGGGRRVSAPPAPTDRELQFSSVCTAGAGGQQLLAAVPEEEQLPPAVAGPQAGGQQPQAAAAAAAAPPAEAPQGDGGDAPAAAAAAPTPASVPAPPRDMAITALTGLASTPLKGGAYQFTDPRTGYVFQLGPASPDSAGMAADDEEEAELCYRPIVLGRAADLLPTYLQNEIKFAESQRANFIQVMMDALVRHKQQK